MSLYERRRHLTADEIAAALADLPHWEEKDGALVRTFRTAGWKGTLMAVNAIAHLAEVAWHHPDLAVSYDRVGVRLFSHDAGGITPRDVALARKLEDVVMWQPCAEPASPLEGTPKDDPRLTYLIYD